MLKILSLWKNYLNLRKGIMIYSKTIFQTSNEKWAISINFIETMCPKAKLMTISYIREH